MVILGKVLEKIIGLVGGELFELLFSKIIKPLFNQAKLLIQVKKVKKENKAATDAYKNSTDSLATKFNKLN